jgi:hypothetical protein
MPSSGILHRVTRVRNGVSEERIASIIKVTTISELGTFLRSARQLLVTANVPSSPILITLMVEALRSFETSGLTRVTRRNIQEDGILHSHRRESLKCDSVRVRSVSQSTSRKHCAL